MSEERKEQKGDVKATKEQREKIWRTVFKLDGVKERVEYKERTSFLGRALGRFVHRADDVVKDAMRYEVLVSLANGLIKVPLGIVYYKGEAKMVEFDLLGLTSQGNLLPSLTNACYLAVQAAKKEQESGYPSSVFYEIDVGSGEILPPVGDNYRREGRMLVPYSLTFDQAKELLGLLDPSEASL